MEYKLKTNNPETPEITVEGGDNIRLTLDSIRMALVHSFANRRSIKDMESELIFTDPQQYDSFTKEVGQHFINDYFTIPVYTGEVTRITSIRFPEAGLLTIKLNSTAI